jgi:hypothetical protein
MTHDRRQEDEVVEPMVMSDRLIYAAAFAGAFAVELRHMPEAIGYDEVQLRAWQEQAAIAAARQALGTVLGLRAAELVIDQRIEALPEGVEDRQEAFLLGYAIEAFRAGDDGEDSYVCDGQCEGMDEDEDEDDEDEDPVVLSQEEQTIVQDVERTLGIPLRFDRVEGPPGHSCECETCEQVCEHREEIVQTVAMLNKVRSGQHDA